jgi:hypothetical protein
VTALEGAAEAFYTAAATDPDGDAVTFALSGADAEHFEIDAETGALSFRDGGPDVAALPEDDKNGDGAPAIAEGSGTTDFALQLIASDGALSDTLDLIVTVEADSDGDGVADVRDNALFVANPNQYDSDGDGYGNIIDLDLNGNGAVDPIDLNFFTAAFGSAAGDIRFNADADANGNGAVDPLDFNFFTAAFGSVLAGQSAVDF